MESGARFLVDARHLQRSLIPTDGSLRNSLVEEALRKPGISLHELGEGMTALCGLSHLLEFPDGFVEQSHFTEGNPEVVMCLRILIGAFGVAFEFLLEFAEHVGKINAGTR